jgi:hypothetical protein
MPAIEIPDCEGCIGENGLYAVRNIQKTHCVCVGGGGRRVFRFKHVGSCTGVLISPYPELLPDVFCLMVRIFRLMLVLLCI